MAQATDTNTTNLSRRALLARGTLLPVAGAVALATPQVAAVEVEDAVVGYFKLWRVAEAESNAASRALESMFAQEKVTGVKHPDHDAIFQRECDCSGRTGAILDAIKDTPATTLAGALCKAIVGYHLIPESRDLYEHEFAIAAFRDIERLLTSMAVEV